MKKLLLPVLSLISLSVYALPTYEPFTEYSSALAANNNGLDLATSGFYLTNGPVVEQWGGGSSGFGLLFAQTGTDVLLTNNSASVFTSGNLAAILPNGFPGAGVNIDVTAYVPHNTGANTAGNSAVLKFAQDIPRPTNGVTTIYVSYLLDVTGNPGAGTGANAGRYAGFLAQTNIYEGLGTGGAYSTWVSMFNTFGASPTYVAYGEQTNKPAVAGGQGDNICPADSSAGAGGTGTSGTKAYYNTANFVVGCFTFTTGGGINDTNTVWINPPLTDFGGPTPSVNNISSFTMSTVMSDVDAFFLESRSGGATGGAGPTFIGNLLIGTTWSYVTGGPEFTNRPADVYVTNYGTNLTLRGGAVAAAQNVTYQWQKVVGGSTNNLVDGTGTAGGSAIISGSTNSSLTLSGISAGDTGTYQLLATASGTGFTLAAPVNIIAPGINANPTNLSFSLAGNQLTLSWPSDHTGWQLQAQTNGLTGANWVAVNGSTTTNLVIIPVNPLNGSVFYRLIYPAQ